MADRGDASVAGQGQLPVSWFPDCVWNWACVAANNASILHTSRAVLSVNAALCSWVSAGNENSPSWSLPETTSWVTSESSGKLTLGSPNVVKSPVGKAGVFHECTHALMDVKGHKVSMQNDEVVAYLADAMYLKKTMTTVSGGVPEMAIYKAAYAIIDAHHMLTKHGVTLKWTDCDALRNAIKAIPAYQ